MTFESLGLFPRFRTAILDLPPAGKLRREQLLSDGFAIARSGRFSVFYAPFDYVNSNARIMIVGVTPGWTQMEAAFVEVRAALADGSSDQEALKRAKRVAAFAGSLRTNLVSMLDDIGAAAADADGTLEWPERFCQFHPNGRHNRRERLRLPATHLRGNRDDRANRLRTRTHPPSAIGRRGGLKGPSQVLSIAAGT